MIEFNLLPDIKLQFIKTKRTKRLIVSVSVIVGAAALAIFIILFMYVDVFQKARINNLSGQINTSKNKLQSNTNLNEILTIQNQLNTLPTLYEKLPTSNQVFNYMSEILPATCTLSSLSVNYTTSNLTMDGTCNTAEIVNQLIDTITFATDQPSGSNASDAALAFSAISYGSISPNGTNGSVNFNIAFNFDPKLFNSQYNMVLTVPSKTTTRSILDQPTSSNLFGSGA